MEVDSRGRIKHDRRSPRRERRPDRSLGPAGPIFRLFALPAARASNTLSLELTCTDRRSGRQVLTKRYGPPPHESTSSLDARESDFEFAALLAIVNREFTEDLRAALR